jgi:hypothetical protein
MSSAKLRATESAAGASPLKAGDEGAEAGTYGLRRTGCAQLRLGQRRRLLTLALIQRRAKQRPLLLGGLRAGGCRRRRRRCWCSGGARRRRRRSGPGRGMVGLRQPVTAAASAAWIEGEPASPSEGGGSSARCAAPEGDCNKCSDGGKGACQQVSWAPPAASHRRRQPRGQRVTLLQPQRAAGARPGVLRRRARATVAAKAGNVPLLPSSRSSARQKGVARAAMAPCANARRRGALPSSTAIANAVGHSASKQAGHVARADSPCSAFSSSYSKQPVPVAQTAQTTKRPQCEQQKAPIASARSLVRLQPGMSHSLRVIHRIRLLRELWPGAPTAAWLRPASRE